MCIRDRYWDEMVRYYSNIVGKYGSPVQKALAKLGGLPISTICSTHGPVWTENIAKVIGIYDKLSRYAADEGVVIAYGSMYGNTEQMAEAIAAELSAQGIKNIVMHNVSKSNPSYIIADIFKYRGLIIGSPTYSNQIYPEIEYCLLYTSEGELLFVNPVGDAVQHLVLFPVFRHLAFAVAVEQFYKEEMCIRYRDGHVLRYKLA